MSQDPSGFGGGDSNLYRYVGNSPTDATDPSGLLNINFTNVSANLLLNGLVVVKLSGSVHCDAGWSPFAPSLTYVLGNGRQVGPRALRVGAKPAAGGGTTLTFDYTSKGFVAGVPGSSFTVEVTAL